LFVAAACSPGAVSSPESTLVHFVGGPGATSTPLATEAAASDNTTTEPTLDATLEPTPIPTPQASVQPAPFYTPPGWDGVSDVNCSAFKTHAQAVSFFIGTGGSTTNDPYHLDNNHDGNPCQSLP